jgi:diamine N-acetyltransferase
MVTLQGKSIYLRALEPADLEFLYAIENNETIWEVSNTQTPYSRFLIRQYLKNAHQDIYEAKQLRLAICRNQDFPAIGLIDLFDFDPKNNRAGVGIVIQNEEDRAGGVGSQALALVIHYAFRQLNLHQLYANIGEKNTASFSLFAKFGFQQIGIKKQWNLIDGTYHDEILFQLINPKT